MDCFPSKWRVWEKGTFRPWGKIFDFPSRGKIYLKPFFCLKSLASRKRCDLKTRKRCDFYSAAQKIASDFSAIFSAISWRFFCDFCGKTCDLVFCDLKTQRFFCDCDFLGRYWKSKFLYRYRPEGIFRIFFGLILDPPRYICFYSEKRQIHLYRPFFSPWHGLFGKKGGTGAGIRFYFPCAKFGSWPSANLLLERSCCCPIATGGCESWPSATASRPPMWR